MNMDVAMTTVIASSSLYDECAQQSVQRTAGAYGILGLDLRPSEIHVSPPTGIAARCAGWRQKGVVVGVGGAWRLGGRSAGGGDVVGVALANTRWCALKLSSTSW
jgi:hypothetical protein